MPTNIRLELNQLRKTLDLTLDSIEATATTKTLLLSQHLLMITQPSTSQLIVSILGSQFPLTLRQIYNKTKANGKNCTYQAIYKNLSQLKQHGIIQKENRQYQLNQNWILQTEQFVYGIKQNYQTK